MFGLISRIVAVPGRRDELIALLLASSGSDGAAPSLPGCLSYVVARDPEDEHALWVTEVWDSADSHRASLERPQVREAIARSRPMIDGFRERYRTEPVGGVGVGRSTAGCPFAGGTPPASASAPAGAPGPSTGLGSLAFDAP